MRRILLIASACLLAAAGSAPAQPDAGSDGVGPGYEETLRLAVAERLARQGVLLARGIQDPSLDDFRVVALTLGEAIELAPGWAELTRLQIDAYRTADDEEGALEATRRLVRQDPSDTAAQLRLITHRIGRLQRIEDRIAALENLLGPEGKRLDASIRSRLAFDAALLTRELGDERGFLRLLRRAVSLDQTNKPAVVLASTLFFDREDDPLLRYEMHEQLLLSDPLDETLHAALARELLRHGAYAGAERFFELTRRIHQRRGSTPERELLSDSAMATWGASGADAYLETIETEDASVRYAIENQRRRLEEAGEDPSQIPDYTPDPVRDRTRALMASALKREEQARRSLVRMSDTMSRGIQQQRDGGASPERVEAIAKRVALELVRLRAWTGVEIERAKRDLDVARENAGDELVPGSVERYEGLFAAHAGDRETAVRLLTPLAESGDQLARVGLGIAAEAAGDRVGALRAYASAVKAFPGTAEGLWARERAELLLGSTITADEAARALNARAASAPKRLERMVRSPDEHLSLRVTFPGERLDPLSPLRARVEMKNRTVFPLAVGPNAPIASRVLLAPKLSIVGAPVGEAAAPEVISMARRLRLEPGASLSAEAWLGPGDLGSILENTAPLAASIRCQAIQGFQYTDERGVYSPGAFGLTASSGVLWRRPERTAPEPASIVELLETARGEALLRGLLEARWALLRSERPEEEAGARESIAGAVVSRWGSMSAMERAFALLVIPPVRNAEASAAVIEAALGSSPDALQALILTLIHATEGEDPSLAIAEACGDEGVREIARLIRLRLELKAKYEAINERLESSGRSPSR